MSYSNANAYREREVLTASPEKLVVMIYDHVLANLRRARMAIETGNVEQRVHALGKARDGVMELLVSTDTERGGDIARNLRALYGFAFKELISVGRNLDTAQLDKITAIMGNLRESFATIAADPSLARSPAA
jgi:flagellar protein FliS